MDFAPSEELRRYVEQVTRFAHGQLNEEVLRHDADGTFPRAAWQRCADFGIQGLAVPAEYGGAGASAETIALTLEALGYGCRDNGLLFAINAHMWACEHPIAAFGTEEQKRRYLPGLSSGALIGAHAMSERGAGSDVSAVTTVATPSADGHVLDGAKMFVTNAPVADVLLVFARTSDGPGFEQLSAFLIDRDAPGVRVSPPLAKMGLRSAQMGEVLLEAVPVPASAMLGPPGAGMAVFNATMLRERSFILATAVGTMRRLLERTVQHARERRQFGEPIGRQQGVSHRIVDMKLRVETSRLLLYQLAWLIDRGRRAAMEASLLKLHLSEAFVQSCLDALHIHGGYGYLTENELEREVRDAIGSRLYSGTSEVQRNLVARQLGL